MKIIPIDFKTVKEFINAHHRHLEAPIGYKYCFGLSVNGELRGAAIAGRPTAKTEDDGKTIYISRTCTLGDRNANSMLMGAALRIAKAMGYERVITYTFQSESGSSLKAVGFQPLGLIKSGDYWNTTRLRNLSFFDNEKKEKGVYEDKLKWQKIL